MFDNVLQRSAHFFVGFDVGQANDYSAVAVLEKGFSKYAVRYLQRLPLDMPYPAQVDFLVRLFNRKPLQSSRKVLAIDYTGVGRPVVDLAQQRGLNPLGIAISGGNEPHWNESLDRVTVPKRDLVGTLQIFAQSDRLKVASNLRFGPVLAQELANFRVKIDTRTAHESYGAWREGTHDDLVLATAIALWAAEHETEQLTHAIARFISVGGRP